MKMVRNKYRRERLLTEDFPFVLPEHIHYNLRDRKYWGNVEGWEEVGRIGNYSIRRRPPTPTKPSVAIEPTPGEELIRASSLTGIAIRLDILKTGDAADLASIAESALTRLFREALAGDGKALWHYARLVRDNGYGLHQITAMSRKVLRPLTRKNINWPMMRSTHPLNSAPDNWLKEMQLGADIPIMLDRYSKWKLDRGARYTMALWRHVEGIRTNHEITIDGKAPRDIFPAFNRDTAHQWWDWAWQFLLASYPQPERIEELDRLVTDPKKRKTPGRKRAAIQNLLKRRFIAMARL
jgi:hypothetical protein